MGSPVGQGGSPEAKDSYSEQMGQKMALFTLNTDGAGLACTVATLLLLPGSSGWLGHVDEGSFVVALLVAALP